MPRIHLINLFGPFRLSFRLALFDAIIVFFRVIVMTQIHVL